MCHLVPAIRAIDPRERDRSEQLGFPMTPIASKGGVCG